MLKILQKIFTPIQLLTSGFVVLILAGTFTLMMPVSTNTGDSQPFIDAFFTATSAVSTTGLIVVDTPVYYSVFGQIIILLLIQIGGLGYMVFFVLIYTLLRNKISLNGKKYLRDSVSRLAKIDLIRFAWLTILFTLIIETAGTIIYLFVWIKDFPLITSLWLSIFHSISAFCTAGFSLYSDSLCSYRDDLIINVNSNFLVITGALGFFVLYDLSTYIKKYFRKPSANRLTVHSKIGLTTTTFLFITGILILFFNEYGKISNDFFENILISSFQVISASTTVGFNSVDIGILSPVSLYVMIILMFVGASPGSTGGGIKTTSFAVFMKFCISTLKGRANSCFFKRTINMGIYFKASAQIFVAITSIAFFMLILSISENQDFLKLLFEAVSGFGTVGLSTGITPQLTVVGKLSIISLMFIGRIGPLVIGLSLLPKSQKNNYAYPEEEILLS